MLQGKVEHEDSLKNKGIIESGDIQWMTAGSGIIHSEMPKLSDDKKLAGFQLWVNLPKKHKMMKPRYQEIVKGDIAELELSKGVKAKLVSGTFAGETGPVKDIVIDPLYLDISLEKGAKIEIPVTSGYTVFSYVIKGKGFFTYHKNRIATRNQLVLWEAEGDKVYIESYNSDLRFLLISGKPLKEPIAWYGPIVMNTKKELITAFQEYQNGSFIKT